MNRKFRTERPKKLTGGKPMRHEAREMNLTIDAAVRGKLFPAMHCWLSLLLAFSLSVAISVPAFAKGGDVVWQTGDPRGGKQEAKSSGVDAAGNVIIAGYQNLSGTTDDDYLTVKLKSDGSGIAWRAAYNKSGGSDQATAVVVDSENNVVVTGYAWNGQNNDIHTIKYNGSTGSVIWEHTFDGAARGDDRATAIAVDNLNNVYVGGFSQNARVNEDYIIVKYGASGPNPDGTPLWHTTWNATADGTDKLASISVGVGCIAATGYSWNGADFDYLTIKFDLNGNKLWDMRHGSSVPAGLKEDQGKFTRIDPAGDVVITGYVSNTIDKDIYTAKYNGATGALVWERTYNGAYDDEPNGLFVDSRGDVYVTGYTWTIDAHNDYYTAKYAGTDGGLLWENTFNSSGSNDDITSATGIVVDEAGDVFVTGYSITAGNYDFQTLKYKKDNGTELWHSSFNGTAGKNDRPVGIGLDPLSGMVYVAGWSDMTASLDSGVATAASTNLTVESAKSWSADQWAGYHVMMTSGGNSGVSRHIAGNSATTLTLSTPFAKPVAAGDTYYLYDQEDLDYHLIKYDPGLLNRPTGLTAQTLSNSSVKLTWTDNTSSETGFNVYRKVGEFGAWERLLPPAPAPPTDPTVRAGVVTYDDTGLTANTYYYYQVTAYDGTESHPSDPAKALTVFVSYPLPAWSFVYNNPDNFDDFANAIAVGPDNNPVVTGQSLRTAGGFDYYTVKFRNSDKSLLWSDLYDSPDSALDIAMCVAVDGAGDAIVSGYSELFNGTSGNTPHIYTTKYPAAGPPALWHHQYIGSARIDDRAVAIASAVDSSNNSVVVGYGKNAAGNEDIYLIKYPSTPVLDGNNSATPAWTATPFDGGGDDFPNTVAFGKGGDIFVTGYSKNVATGNYDVFVAKYSGATGARIWTDTFEGPGLGDDRGAALATDAAGDFYVAGVAVNAAGNKDFFTIKYDGSSASVQRLWQPTFFDGAAHGDDEAVAVSIDPIDGAVVVAGTTLTAAGDHDFTIVRYTPAGQPLWSRTLQRPADDDYLKAMGTDNSGNIIVTGHTGDGVTTDSMTLKYDYEGTLIVATIYDGAAQGFDQSNAIAVNSLGEAYIAGYTTNVDGNADYLVYSLPAEPIQAPLPLTAAPKYTTVALSWQDYSTVEDGYHIQRKVGACSAANVWTQADLIKTTNPDATSYPDAGLTSGQTYCYRVQSFRTNGAESRWVEKQVTTAVPAAPGSVTATPDNTTQVTVNWSDNTGGETGFRVERCLDAGAGCDFTTRDTFVTAPDATTFTDSTACADKTYNYRVMAINRGLSFDGGGAWTRRAPLSIADFQPNVLTRMTIAYDGRTDLAGVPMKADFSDIRFYDETGRTELPYWIESKSDGVSANVWIMGGANNAVYLYYGNAGAAGASNVNNIFGSGLVGYWPFNESAGIPAAIADLSGRGNNAALNGFISPYGVVSAGKYGNGLSLDGSNDYLTVPDTTGSSLDITGSITVEMWYKYEQSQPWARIISKPTAGGPQPWDLYAIALNDNGNRQKPYFVISSTNTWNNLPTDNYVVMGPELVVGNWYHLVGRYNRATGRVSIIVDGIEYGATVTPITLAVSNDPLTMGTRGVYGGNAKGGVDEVRIYSRALTDEEIARDSRYAITVTVGTAEQEGAGYVFAGTFTGLISATAQAKTPSPGQPGPLTLSRVSEAQINLSWTDTTTDETGFRVERCKDASCVQTELPSHAGTGAMTLTDTGLEPNTTYSYSVRALKTGACGWDDAVSALVSETTTVNPPVVTSVTAVNTTRLDVAWTDDVVSNSGYRVERCAGTSATCGAQGASFSVIGGSTARNYSDTEACAGTDHTYRVCAVFNGLSGSGAPWSMRAPLTFDNNSFQPNFKTRLTVYYNAAMNPDFSDIRFYDAAADRELPYWIESKTDGVSANVWIKTGDNNAVYLYYGNRNATSASKLSGVFGSGLMGYWQFNEPAGIPAVISDLSGQGNNVVPTSFIAPYGVVAGGKYGNALSLSGAANHAKKDTVTLPTGNVATVEAWIFPTGYSPGNAYNGIVSWGPRSGTAVSLLLSIQDGGRPSMATWGNDFVPGSGPAATLNAWNHIAVVLDGKAVTLYMNGQPVSGAVSADILPSIQSKNLSIGSTDNPGRNFQGKIDEVRIYNRALSPQEIASSYAAVLPSASVNLGAAEPAPAIPQEWQGSCSLVTPQSAGKTPVPPKPTGLTLTWVSEAQLDLGWTDNANDESGYYVERMCTAGPGCTDTDFAPVPNGDLSPRTGTGAMTFSDKTGLRPNNIYAYRVRPYKNVVCGNIWDNAGGSLYSDVKSATTTVKDPSAIAATAAFGTSCNDIRLTDSDGSTSLSQWVQQLQCNTTGTRVWPKVPTIPVGDKTIYLYYGNSSAPSVDNGDTTFEFFDDFSGKKADGSPLSPPYIDPDKWTVNDLTGFSVSGGYLHGTNTTGRLTSKFLLSADKLMTLKAKTTSSATGGQIIGGVYLSATDHLGFLNRPADGGYQLNGSQVLSVATPAPAHNLGYTLNYTSPSTVNMQAYDWDTGAWYLSPLTVSATIAGKPVVLGRQYVTDGANGQAYLTDWDWVLVRKVANPAPTAALGQKEYGSFNVGGDTFSVRKPITITHSATGAAPLTDYQLLFPTVDTTSLATDRITIGWVDNTATESGFTIERCTAGPAGSADCTSWDRTIPVAPNATSYADTNLPLATKYCYQIRVDIPDVVTTFSAPVCATTSVPTPPFNLTVSVNGTRVDLAWSDTTPGVPDGYMVERCSDTGSGCVFSGSDPSFTTFTVDRASKAFIDPSACSGIYNYRVKSVKPWISGWPADYTNVVTASLTIPPKPTGVTASRSSESQINLTWTDNTTDETGYRVERKCVSGPPSSPCPDSDFHQVGQDLPANPGTGAMSFNDFGLTPDTTYLYQVTSFKSAGCSWLAVSDPSADETTTLTNPANLTATAINTTQINLSWSDTTSGESGFVVERCTDDACTTPTILTPPAGVNATNYADTTVCNALTPYYYRVKAFKSANLSSAGGGAWTRRALLAITGFQPNYQMKLTIRSADYPGMQPDFRDVRFYDATTGSELSYWIEGVSAGTAVIWVKTAANSAIYLYYGNTAAADASSAASTFEFFDDFSGTNIDASRWNVVDPTGFTVSGGSLHGTSTSGRLTSKATFAAGITLDIKARTTAVAVNGQAIGGFYLSAANHIGWMADQSTSKLYAVKNGSIYRNTNSSTANLLYTLTVKSASTSSQQLYNLDSSSPDQYLGTGVDTSFTFASSPIVLGRSYKDDLHNGQAYATDWDWIRVRKYAAVEPAVTVGAVESSAGYSFVNTWYGDTPYSATAFATTSTVVPPGGLSATRASEAQINLSWTDNANDETGFKVERCTGATCDFTTLDVGFPVELGANAISYSDPLLVPDTPYRYRVRAYKTAFCNGGWTSDPSNVSGDVTTGIAPASLTATPFNTTQMDISWSDTTQAEKGFIVERCEGSDCNFTQIGSVGPHKVNLLALYTFNNNLNDSSGNGLNLTGPAPVYDEGGLLMTTGTVYQSPVTSILDTDDHTIEFDIKIRSTNAGWTRIFSYTPAGTDRSPGLWLADGNRALLHWRYDPANKGVDYLGVNGNNGTPFTLGAWYHVRGVKTGRYFKVYVDGTLVVDMIVSNPKTAGPSALYFGGADVSIRNFTVSSSTEVVYSDTTACNAVPYSYRVRAVNGGLAADGGGCWKNRALLAIGGFQPNHQTRVTIAYNAAMNADFSDIRFYDATSRSELPYWIEKKTDGASATVWFKSGMNNNIYLYYGNGSALPAADGAAVFEFFDDFAGTVVDSGKWKIIDGTGFSVSGGYLHGTNSTGRLTSAKPYASGVVLDVKAKTTLTAPSGQTVGGLVLLPDLYNYMGFANAAGAVTYTYNTNSGPLPAANMLYTIKVKDSQTTNLQVDNWDTGTPFWVIGNVSKAITGHNIVLGRRVDTTFNLDHLNEPYVTDWDWVRVRRYAAAEPTVSVGDRETSSCYAFDGSWPVPLYSNTVQKATAAPAVPGGLGGAATDSQVSLSWNDNTGDEAGFKVERCADSGCASAAEIGTSGPNVNLFTDTGLSPSTNYCYRVRAYKPQPCNSEWNSGYSPVACVATGAARPFNLTAVALNSMSVRLDWSSDVAANEDGFEIERQVWDGEWQKWGKVEANVTTFTDTVGVEPLKRYRYRVRAFNNNDFGDFDAGIDATKWDQRGVVLDNAGAIILDVKTPPITIVDANGTEQLTAADGNVEFLTSSPGGGAAAKYNWLRMSLKNPAVVNGDFDLQIDYRLPDGQVSSANYHVYGRLQVNFLNTAGGSNYAYIERAIGNGDNNYGVVAAINGATSSAAVITADTSGKLRITRKADTVSLYAWTGGKWSLVHEVTGASASAATFVGFTQYVQRIEAVGLRTVIDNFALSPAQSEYSNTATVTFTNPDGSTIFTTPAYAAGDNVCR
ncbi:Fibronectin, type III domain protein [Geotalea uraniireducens Rf4]|uniref:Fibronectin, type III domain protein n=2 Tax=Geotalea uraniireducens TaxID=351604 RepID=A5GCA4_GEOUR|nr:Fibronectin, type III domain protein [Geotalea uraniireducens Rf4]